MHAHALRHILLKALAFGVIAVMLTGVCVAQKKTERQKLDSLYLAGALAMEDGITIRTDWSRYYYLMYAANYYYMAGQVEKSRNISLKVLNSNGKELKRGKLLKKYDDYYKQDAKHNASYILAKIYIDEKNYKKGLAYLDSSNYSYKEVPPSCGVGLDYAFLKEIDLYATCYLNLKDTVSAIKVLIQGVFLSDKDDYFGVQDKIVDLLYKKYPVYYFKSEFLNAIKNYPIGTEYITQGYIKIWNSKVNIYPLFDSSGRIYKDFTPQVVLKEFLKTNFYKKLMARAPAQWLFYPVALN